jgi:glycosyltransferase involved in cell wall biosynthesis
MSEGRQGPIALFLPSVRGGGAQRIVVNLAQGMTERGLPVDVVLTTAEGVFMDQLPTAARVVDLRSRRVVGCLGPLAAYLRAAQPRVLVSSMSHANVIAIVAARLSGSGTPVVVTEHNTMSVAAGESALARRLWPPLLRLFYPLAESVVAVSQGAADDFARTTGLPRDRIEVVYNPVVTPELMALARQTPDHPWFAPGGPPVVLAVGRLTAQKDFPTLLRAFALLRARCPARLVILGEGEDRSALEALILELGLADSVALPGFRANAMAYMARSALFVLSSAWEGLPTVLIEALAAGTRVVSTDCPSGPREILQAGRLGRLVPVGDPERLAGAMAETLDEPRSVLPGDLLEPYTRKAAVDHYLRVIESAQ